MSDTKEELQEDEMKDVYESYLNTLSKEDLIIKITCHIERKEDEEFKEWKADIH